MINSRFLFDAEIFFEELSTENFTEKVLLNEKPVLVEFTADWFKPCEHIKSSLNALSKKYRDSVMFFRVDMDKGDDLAKSYDIYLFPALLFFKNGDKMDQLNGTNSREDINKKLLSLLK